MDSTVTPKRGMLRDWGYYSLWWGLIFTILGSLMYRDGPQDQFLNPALQQALFGGVVQITLQRMTHRRGRMRSWFWTPVSAERQVLYRPRNSLRRY